MQPLDKAFMGPPKTFLCQKNENWLRSNSGRFVTVYQTGKLENTSNVQLAQQRLMTAGRQAFALLT
jgi:hypothetical protein